jgi:O-antigen ligase
VAGTKGVVGLTTTRERSHGWNFRLALICFSAVSVGLPIAWISLAKVLVIVVGLGYLVANIIKSRPDKRMVNSLTAKFTLLALLAFAVSLIWTKTSQEIALLAFVKHAKLMVVLLLILLVRTRREARFGIIAFAAAQTFLLFSSLLLAAGVPVPWVTDPTGKYVVFSTYLDQSIMLSTSAAVIWHLRQEKLWPGWLAWIVSTAALVDAVVLLDGRTGYAVAIAMLTLAAMWAMPRRLRFATFIATPILVLGGMYWGSNHIQSRMALVFQESKSFSQQVETNTSSGWRLNAWQRSIEALQESPWHGHGVGSWAISVKRLQGDSGTQTFGEGNASNPHQEYLLWGVELGVAGSILFAAVLLAMALDARRFSPPIRKALWSVIAALAVASLFNSILYDDLIGDFFCVALGLLLAMGFRQEPLKTEGAA